MRIWAVAETISGQTQSIIAAAEARGHNVSLFKPSQTDLLFSKAGPLLHSHCAGVPVGLPDIVLTRIPGTLGDNALHMIRQLELADILCVNSAASLDANRNKIRANSVLSAHGLPIPRTSVIIPQPDDAERKRRLDCTLEDMVGPPWIVKLPQGRQGEGVILVESAQALRAMIDTFMVLNQPILLQQCIPEAMASDIRAFVIGGKCVAVVRRNVPRDDFRANGAGDGEVLAAEEELTQLAEQAAQAIGLEIAGIDLVSTRDGYLILDVNGSPGLLGIQKLIDSGKKSGAPSIDLATTIVEYLETRARK